MSQQDNESPRIDFKCPHCGLKLSADPEMAGRSVQCPGAQCGQTIQIPAPAAPAAAAPAPAGPPSKSIRVQRAALNRAAVHRVGLATARRPRRPKAAAKSRVWLYALILFVVLGAGVSITYLAGNGGRRSPPPAPPPALPGKLVAVMKPGATNMTPVAAATNTTAGSTGSVATASGSATNGTGVAGTNAPPRHRRGEMTPEERDRVNARLAKALEKKQAKEQKAFEKLKEKAESGDADAQAALGDCYRNGQGCEVDLDEARTWYTKAVEANVPKAHFGLGMLDLGKNQRAAALSFFKAATAFLERNQREEAVRAIEEIARAGHPDLAQQLIPYLQDKPGAKKSGTGWFGPGGYIVTCFHVVAFRDNLYVESDTLEKTRVTIFKEAPEYDVAILKLEDPETAKPGIPLATEPARLGQSIFTMGYPMINVMGKALKVTDGSVSSLSGLNDNPRDIQISAPVQSGNSGGPLIDMDGEVIGIVASKLNAADLARVTGDLAQNVNYAVKAAYLRELFGDDFPAGGGKTLKPEAGTLETLIARLQDCIVRVYAE